MSKYIKIEDAIEAAINGCATWDGGYVPSMDVPIKAELEGVDDKRIDLVRCKECKHHYTADCPLHFEYDPLDDWFCGDGDDGKQ